jgi:hypothetical protein
VNELSSQIVTGWALLQDDIIHVSFDLRGAQAQESFQDSPTGGGLELCEVAEAIEDGPLGSALRAVAHGDGMLAAPTGFSARVASRLPATPPPLHPDATASHAFGQYAALKQHAGLVFGAVSFSALLSFVTSWLLASAVPSLGFALLATLVTLGIVLVDVLRTLVQVTAGAATNPVLVLAAMSGPLIVFLLACTQLARLSRAQLAGLAS